jgi:uncharacterized protein
MDGTPPVGLLIPAATGLSYRTMRLCGDDMCAPILEHMHIPLTELAELCRRYHVLELSLFGSVLRDDFRPDSDIDVLVEYEPDAVVTLFDHFDFEQALGRLFARPVDLVSKRGLRPSLREDVLRSIAVVYAA